VLIQFTSIWVCQAAVHFRVVVSEIRGRLARRSKDTTLFKIRFVRSVSQTNHRRRKTSMTTMALLTRRRCRAGSKGPCHRGGSIPGTMIVQLVLLELLVGSDHCRSARGWRLADRPAATPRQRAFLGSRRNQALNTHSLFSRKLHWNTDTLMRHAARKNDGPSARDDGGGFLDVEFERVAEVGPNEDTTSGSAAKRTTVDESLDSSSSKSWIEWSLEADPELNSTRIPFFGFRPPSGGRDDNDDNRAFDSIDVKLAFLVELDGETYGIGTPFDHAVALTVETIAKGRAANDINGGDLAAPNVQNLPPTSDNEELMENMATQLHESVGNDLKLVRTPRVLTVRGPLERYTQNWRTELLPEPLTAEQLLDDSDEDVDDFLKFMRRELGDQEVERTLRGDSKMSADEAELMEMFNIPGMGDQHDDGDGIQELLESLLESPQDQEEQFQKLDPAVLSGQGAAIKLFSYIMPDSGKVYSLVSLLQPYVLVARRVSIPSSGDGYDSDELARESVRFELLSSQEEELLIPRLEQVCQDDLERAGLQLRASSPEPTPALEP
jgi:hypothetical protein